MHARYTMHVCVYSIDIPKKLGQDTYLADIWLSMYWTLGDPHACIAYISISPYQYISISIYQYINVSIYQYINISIIYRPLGGSAWPSGWQEGWLAGWLAG